jgi:hypothetical protein
LARLSHKARRERLAALNAIVELLTTDAPDIESAIVMAHRVKNGKPRQLDGNPSPAKPK